MEQSKYSTEVIRNSLKVQYDYKIKIIDFAEQGMKLIGEILERKYPDIYSGHSLEFGFSGNAAFVYLNCPYRDDFYDDLVTMYDKLRHNFLMYEDSEEYKLRQYFDFISPNTLYPTVLRFRINDARL